MSLLGEDDQLLTLPRQYPPTPAPQCPSTPPAYYRMILRLFYRPARSTLLFQFRARMRLPLASNEK
jgi:hypothetical protein